MKKYYFIFVFKQRLRKVAWNNFLKIKRIKNYRIIDLSGPVKFFVFSRLLIFINNLFYKKISNLILISCDGLPFIKKNGVNMWFGGTKSKIPTEFKKYQNNLVTVNNIFYNKKNLITLYPKITKNETFTKNFKIIYISSIELNYSKQSKEIWKRYRSIIVKDFSLIDKEKFWQKKDLKKLNQRQDIYRDLKSFLRVYIIKKINTKFKKDLIIIGNDWKRYIKNAQSSNHDLQYIRAMYKGNICLDFGSRWGDNVLYARSIEILESGGYLLQSTQSDSVKSFSYLKTSNNFSTVKELVEKLNMYKQNYNLLNQNYKKIFAHYKNDKFNYKTLTFIKKISEKNIDKT